MDLDRSGNLDGGVGSRNSELEILCRCFVRSALSVSPLRVFSSLVFRRQQTLAMNIPLAPVSLWKCSGFFFLVLLSDHSTWYGHFFSNMGLH